MSQLVLALICLVLQLAEVGLAVVQPPFVQNGLGFSVVSPFASRLDPPMVFETPLDPTRLRSVRYSHDDIAGGFNGACTDGNYIYMAPLSAKHLVRISRKTGVFSNASDFEWPADVDFGTGAGSFCGCAFDGFRGIWLVPHRASHLVRVDTITRVMTSYNQWPSEVTLNPVHNFCGAVIDIKRQNLWLMAFGASHAVRVEHAFDNKMSDVPPGPTITGMVMHAGADFPVELGMPGSQLPFSGGVLAKDSIWLVPFNGKHVVEMPLDGSPMSSYGSWPNSITLGDLAFTGGVFDGVDSVWFVPHNAKHVVKININNGGMKAVSLNINLPSYAFTDAAFDGQRMWMANSNMNAVVAVDTTTQAVVQFSDWPKGFVLRTLAFGSVVFDGCSVWLIPRGAHDVVRLIDTSKAILGQNGIASHGWQRSSRLADGFAPPLKVGIPTGKYYATVRADDHVWMIPLNNAPALRVHINTGATKSVPWSTQFPATNGAVVIGAGYDGHGRIWLAPRNTNEIIIINTAPPHDVSSIPSTISGDDSFHGACMNNRGQLIMAPRLSAKVLSVDVRTGNVETFDKWPAGVLSTKNAQFSAAICNHFDSATYFAPLAMRHIVKFNPLAPAGHELTAIAAAWPSDLTQVSDPSANMFSGGTLDADGTLWLAAQEMDFSVSLDLNDPQAAMKSHPNWAYPSDKDKRQKLRGFCSDGHSIFGSPHQVSGMCIINASHPDTGNMKAVITWPLGVSQNEGFAPPLFDGVSIWLADRDSVGASSVRFVDRRKVLFGGDGFSSYGLISRVGMEPLPKAIEETVAESFGPFAYRHFSAVYDGTRYMYLPPLFQRDALGDGLIRVDVQTGERTAIITTWPGLPFSMSAWGVAFGGGVMVGADHIFLVPGADKTVVRVNLDNQTITTVGPSRWPEISGADGGTPFVGGAFDGTFIWMFPRRASHLLKIHHETLELTRSAHGVAAPTAPPSHNFCGGVYDGEAYFILIPEQAQVVVRIRRDNGAAATISKWPAGVVPASASFCGGVFDGTWVWMAPTKLQIIIKVHPILLTMVAVGDVSNIPHQSSLSRFHGACSDGEHIYFTPYSAKGLLRVNIANEEHQYLQNWPTNHTFASKGTYFAGCVFDGRSVWIIPTFNGDLIRWRRLDSNTIIAQDGGTYTGPIAVTTPLPSVIDWNGTSHGILHSGGGYASAIFDASNRTLYILPMDKVSYEAGVVKIETITNVRTHIQLPSWPNPSSTHQRSSGSVFVARLATIFMIPGEGLRCITMRTFAPHDTGTFDLPSDIDFLSSAQTSFVGGTFDGSHIWMSPYRVSHVVKYNVDTSDVTLALDLRGVFGSSIEGYFCGAVADGQSDVYFIPFRATGVLRININTGGHTTWNKWPTTNNFVKGSEVLFCGGTVAAGKLWLSPFSSSGELQIVSVDLHSGAMEALPFPVSGGAEAAAAACFDGVSVFFIPHKGDGLVSLNPRTNTMEVRKTFPWIGGSGAMVAGKEFRGCVFDGQSLWLVPRSGGGELVQFSALDNQRDAPPPPPASLPNQDGYSFYPPIPGATALSGDFFAVTYNTGPTPFHGSVISPSGQWVYMMPWHGDRVVSINTFTGRTYESIHTPLAGSTTMQYCGCAMDEELNIFLAPFLTAKAILRFNTTDSTFTEFPRSMAAKTLRYCGAVATKDTIFFAPVDAATVLMLHKENETLGNVALPIEAEKAQNFLGAVLDGDGWIWFVPAHAKQFVKMHTVTTNMVVISTPIPLELNTAPTAKKFVGGTFDGSFLWFTARESLYALKVDPVSSAMRLIGIPADYQNVPNSHAGLHFARYDMGSSIYMFHVPYKRGRYQLAPCSH